MKILIVTNMYPTEDAPFYGIFVSEQVKALKKACPNIEFGIYNIQGNKSKKEYIYSLNGVYNEIERGGYDLVHIHYGFSGLFLLNPFKKCKVPIVLTLHGGDIQAEQGKNVQVYFTKKILKKVSHVITLNEKMDSIARAINNKTSIIPCSTNTDFFIPSSEKIKSDILKVVFPSAHTRGVKNYPLFCKTLEILEKKYKIKCQEFELNNMTRAQVRDLYGTADLMLMTSISEGSPQVVKEAMACNLPVVTTKVGDVDVLLDGVANSGWVSPHDANLLAEKVFESISGNIKGIPPRDKIFKLGIDDNSIALKILFVYKKLLNLN